VRNREREVRGREGGREGRRCCVCAAAGNTKLRKKCSWEYYYAAAEEVMPLYHVEVAKSGRSACSATGEGKKCSEDSDPNAGGAGKKGAKGRKGGKGAKSKGKEKAALILTAGLHLQQGASSGSPLAPKKPKLIEKGEIRIGSINVQAGTYGRWWVHACARALHARLQYAWRQQARCACCLLKGMPPLCI